MKEAADTSIPKVDCREKGDMVKINKATLKLIKKKRKRKYACLPACLPACQPKAE